MRGVDVTLHTGHPGADYSATHGDQFQEIVVDSTLGFLPVDDGGAITLFADEDIRTALFIDGPNETAVPYLRGLAGAASALADDIEAGA